MRGFLCPRRYSLQQCARIVRTHTNPFPNFEGVRGKITFQSPLPLCGGGLRRGQKSGFDRKKRMEVLLPSPQSPPTSWEGSCEWTSRNAGGEVMDWTPPALRGKFGGGISSKGEGSLVVEFPASEKEVYGYSLPLQGRGVCECPLPLNGWVWVESFPF